MRECHAFPRIPSGPLSRHGPAAPNPHERSDQEEFSMLSLRLAAVCVFALVVLALTAAPEQAQARPLYRQIFAQKYPELKQLEMEKKCGICHPVSGKNKIHNDYGYALKKKLGETKNEKDKEKLAKLITELEEEKGATPKEPDSKEMRTFGELIKEGKLPGTNEQSEEEKKEEEAKK
jgi:hypothetical protein